MAKKADGAGVGHNSALTDDERRMLAFRWRDRYLTAKNEKDLAAKLFREVCKSAEEEMGDDAIDVIRQLIALSTPEGEFEERARLRREADALRWSGIPLGTQLDFILSAPDIALGIERAYGEGQKASAENQPAKCDYAPETPEYRSYMDGYAAHQTELMARLGTGNGAGQSPS
jgi:hypothetical protein